MSPTGTDTIKILSKNHFPVVGIGASAGGLEAFKKLIRSIPEKSGMAYILVQHLHPDHTSSLPEILQRETLIPVQEISNNVEVLPDNIYIIPANKILTATDGILKISPRPSKDQKNMPIDIFFSSLAEVHQSHAIGIVLSGTGLDGTLGLKKIKDQGGITFAQDSSAAYDAMPLSAVNAKVVDFIPPPEKMPQQLLDLNRTLNLIPAGEETVPDLAAEENFREILSLLRISHGVDFTYCKQTTIRRRILRRLGILNLEKISDYLVFLNQHRPELDLLFQDLLIPVTTFFRDPKIFDGLCNHIFPELIKDKSPAKPLRIWIAGCSTGEEAYSIGICLHEYLSERSSPIKIQIFATDISEKSITKARIGIYSKKDLENVSELRLGQFFIKTNGGYQIKKMIRNMCVFACHNFLKDPPFAKIDFISCRNVLIYLEPFLQKKAFTTFHYALNENGYLLLGNAETADGAPDLFLPFGKKEKLYLRKTLPGRFMRITSERSEEKIKDKDYGLHSAERKKDDFQKNADDILLSKYTPAGVIVNDQLDIVQFRGSTGEYLEPPPGKATWNLLKMAREGLSFELQNAIHKASISKESFSKDGILINNGKKTVSIEVIPLLNTVDLHYLILFRDSSINGQRPASGDQQPGISHINDEKEDRIRKLEKDLSQYREDMRSITEEQEAVNEELQSANEELLSGSEELQSLNEELETSKEELQSTNEELITVNQELFDRNEQLNHARLYAEAIVTTIHEPLLILNGEFKIISANKSFYKDFSITEQESTGGVLFELQNNGWNIPGFREKLSKIHSRSEVFLEWEDTFNFPLAGTRSICFNAQPIQHETGENWILLAFNDITPWKNKEAAEKKNSEDLKKILETLPEITSTSAPDGSPTYFNRFFLDYSGMTLTEALARGWEDIVKPEMSAEIHKFWARALSKGEDFSWELQLKRHSDNMYRWHLCRASAIRNERGAITSWVGVAIDIHDQKTKEQAKDEFISIASHELKTPLTTAKAYIQLLQQCMEKSDRENHEYAHKAVESINRLNDLIEELLDVTKIKTGKLELDIEKFDFNEMMKSAIESIQLTSPYHHIIQSGEAGSYVAADSRRLRQVVLNLLTNAIKYSPDGQEIFVEVLQNNQELKVSVRDNGMGIQKENLSRIFELYYREESGSLHFQGLGIGLSISQEIIRLHKGRIWAESEPDKGSTFYFTLPMSME